MKGFKHGKGKYIWPDQSYYDGDWFENKINGKVNCENNIGKIRLD